MKDNKTIILAIESSCDETSVAVMADGREILSNIISSQIEIHKLYGGVVPEIASRHHLENINVVIEQAMTEADITKDDIDAIGVTYWRRTCGSPAYRDSGGKGAGAGVGQTPHRRSSYTRSYFGCIYRAQRT